MPTVSGKQYRMMAGIKSGTIKATGGLSQAKAAEFVAATPPKMRSKWASKKKKNI